MCVLLPGALPTTVQHLLCWRLTSSSLLLDKLQPLRPILLAPERHPFSFHCRIMGLRKSRLNIVLLLRASWKCIYSGGTAPFNDNSSAGHECRHSKSCVCRHHWLNGASSANAFERLHRVHFAKPAGPFWYSQTLMREIFHMYMFT